MQPFYINKKNEQGVTLQYEITESGIANKII